jgi:hypothetical protein
VRQRVRQNQKDKKKKIIKQNYLEKEKKVNKMMEDPLRRDKQL